MLLGFSGLINVYLKAAAPLVDQGLAAISISKCLRLCQSASKRLAVFYFAIAIFAVLEPFIFNIVCFFSFWEEIPAVDLPSHPHDFTSVTTNLYIPTFIIYTSRHST